MPKSKNYHNRAKRLASFLPHILGVVDSYFFINTELSKSTSVKSRSGYTDNNNVKTSNNYKYQSMSKSRSINDKSCETKDKEREYSRENHQK